jgi:hypothetical protein
MIPTPIGVYPEHNQRNDRNAGDRAACSANVFVTKNRVAIPRIDLPRIVKTRVSHDDPPSVSGSFGRLEVDLVC